MRGISGKARLAGVIGHPVSHSLSPAIHHYWLERYGVDGVYVPLAIAPEDFGALFQTLPKMGFAGVNLTLPYKEKVFPLLDEIDETAQAIGAVNTVVFKEGRAIGSNTDAYGFWESLQACEALGQGKKKVLVLGAGGAAKAVVYALHRQGYECVIANRSREKAEAIASQYNDKVTVVGWGGIASLLPECGMVVNTTSLGMEGQPPLVISLEGLPVTAIVSDIVYRPRKTGLLVEAEMRGNPTVEGLGMLLHQAREGFRQWFGVLPEVDRGLWDHLLLRL